MGLVVRGESWKTLGAAFHAAEVVLTPPPSGQYVVLSTCNRKEMFCWEPPHGVRRTQDSVAAIAYLYRIAAGLESMVLGEYQILGQVREAFAAARAEGHVGKELDRIFRDAISCAKRVKTELDLGAVPPSVCRAGMDEVERRTGCRGKRVFVIGSGRTGTLAAELAAARGAAALAICNRSPERALDLARRLGARVVPYESRYAEIAASDIVISATASPHTVVAADRLVLTRPTLLLDLASPCDVEPAVARHPLAELIGIGTIGELAAGDRAEREALTAKGRRIVDEAVDRTEAWLDAL